MTWLKNSWKFGIHFLWKQVVNRSYGYRILFQIWKLAYRVLQRHKLPKLWRGQQIKVISSCSFYFGDLSRLNEGENFECQWLYNYLLSVICNSLARKQYVSILSQKKGQKNTRSNFSRLICDGSCTHYPLEFFGNFSIFGILALWTKKNREIPKFSKKDSP